MQIFFKKIDFLSPEITLYHKGELFHYSIISGITSLISILLVIASGIYFSKTFILRINPVTYIYETYTKKKGSLSINSTSFLHYITMTSYNMSEFFEFDYNSFRIIGMETPLNAYTEYYKKNITFLDHWLYGPCNIDNDYLKSTIYEEILNQSVCIKKYYSYYERKYYDINDENFRWPNVNFGDLYGGNIYYSIVLEKCEENTLKIIRGEGNHCKSDLEINKKIERGEWVIFNFLDSYIDLFNYNKPNNTYFHVTENIIQNDFIFINNLNLNNLYIKTNKGLILDFYEEKNIFQFERNDILTINQKDEYRKIYLNYNILVNDRVKTYERKYNKLQDFIAEIGGFTKFISFIAQYFIRFFNEYIILRDTKKLISSLHNKELNGDKKNKQIKINNIIKINDIEKNSSFTELGENNLKLDSKSVEIFKKSNSEIILNKINNNINDTNSIFNEKNKQFSYCSFILYQFSCQKKNQRYKIYSNFRNKIISEEQLIKNHIIVYNLINTNNLNNQIYSLKEMINND